MTKDTGTPARPPARRRRGRPSKLTPEVTDKILAALRAGNYLEVAADYAGVGKTTVYRWLDEGAADNAPAQLRAFFDAVTRARAETEVRVLSQVMRVIAGGNMVRRTTRTLRDGTQEVDEQYAPGDGKVALEFLSRAYPSRWARRQALEVSGPGGGPLQLASEERLTALAERVQQALAAASAEDVMDAEWSEDAQDRPAE